MYYCGFTYAEAYNLPVPYKKWFIERFIKEMKREDGSAGNSRAAHDNTPEARTLTGKSRAEAPARMRRFT